jgi:hypothetical protein
MAYPSPESRKHGRAALCHWKHGQGFPIGKSTGRMGGTGAALQKLGKCQINLEMVLAD